MMEQSSTYSQTKRAGEDESKWGETNALGDIASFYYAAGEGEDEGEADEENDSRLFAETRSVLLITVRTSWPPEVPEAVQRTKPRQPAWSCEGRWRCLCSFSLSLSFSFPCSFLWRGRCCFCRGVSGWSGGRGRGSLQKLRPNEQLILELPICIQRVRAAEELDRLCEQRAAGRLAGEHGLVGVTGAANEQDVGWDICFSLLCVSWSQ
jgi:hypothetical protein